ncbi:uncharacterized protein [Nicotiana tomentosiformis]|uniref:uncharacterized protein n=1 Tax=Nicotiana tomentosiformis TaxID=4098 RepID=UPI00388CA09D
MDWANVKMLVDVLEKFHIATKGFLGQYYPIISNCLVYIAELENLFAYFSKGGEIYQLAIDSMRRKFKKYFSPIPTIYGVANLLNPYIKLGFPQFLYETIYKGLALEDDEEPKLPEAIALIRTNTETIYNAYQVLLNQARLNVPTPSSSDSQSFKRTVEVRGLSVWAGFGGSFSSCSNDFSQLNELEVYMSLRLDEVNPDDTFDILQWWKDKEKYFRFFQGWPEIF